MSAPAAPAAPSAPAGPCRPFGPFGPRRLDQLGQHRGHATLDGLERLPGEALVGLAQAPAERTEQLDRDVGMLAQQPAHVASQYRHRLGLLERLDGGGTALVIEDRQLAEDVARPQGGQGDRASTGVLAHSPHVAGADDVAGVALIALVKHCRAGFEATGDRHRGHARQLLIGQRREHRHLMQKRDRLLAGRRHRAEISQPAGETRRFSPLRCGVQIRSDRGPVRAGAGGPP